MNTSKQEIMKDIQTHMSKGGGSYRAWYVGISKNARDRLFNGHGVRENGDWWIYRTANSAQSAREIEDHFVHGLGTDGGSGGGKLDANQVYAYKKAPHTNP